MTNPQVGIIAGYASEFDAHGAWAQLKDNDNFQIMGVNIGFGQGNPAQKNVCWVILPKEDSGRATMITARNLLCAVLSGVSFPKDRAQAIVDEIDRELVRYG